MVRFDENMLNILVEAKRVWDDTLDVKEVAEVLCTTKDKARRLCNLFITENQVRQILNEY